MANRRTTRDPATGQAPTQPRTMEHLPRLVDPAEITARARKTSREKRGRTSLELLIAAEERGLPLETAITAPRRADDPGALPPMAWDPFKDRRPRSGVWALDPSTYPARGSTPERLRWCLQYAILAPSSHNSQPWLFRVEGSRVDVLADRRRALPVADPDDRELMISCGCAVGLLELGMKRVGLQPEVELCADASDRDLVARVRAAGRATPGDEERRMADAALVRRTARVRFLPDAVPTGLLSRLEQLAAESGASLQVLADAERRRRLATLVHEADVVQLANKAFRRELAMWMHHNRSGARDGIPGYAMGMGELGSLVAPLVVRTFDIGQGRGARDEHLAMLSPVLAVLGTPGDTPADHVRAGIALVRVLLRATADRVASSYLNQPCELPEMRGHLARLVPGAGWPQIVLRMGYCPRFSAFDHTPRRGVDEVLVR
jgi:nitroreductase